MPIPVYPWIAKAAKFNWGFGQFLDWLDIHPLVIVPRGIDIAGLWRTYHKGLAFRDIIPTFPQDMYVYPEYFIEPLFPGRTHKWTYTIQFEATPEGLEAWETQTVSTISSFELTPEQAMASHQERILADPEFYQVETSGWRVVGIEYNPEGL